MAEGKTVRHCRHCAGGHAGECLLEHGRCIHGWASKQHPRVFSWQLLLTRAWWRRVLWGDHL